MDTNDIELHPLEPFFPDGAKVLMLGSFPPKKERWKMNFYYPNFQNDMWRIFGLVFFEDKDYFLTEDKKSFHEMKLRNFLTEKRIALWDTGMQVKRLKDNASDKFLEIVRPIDLENVLQQLTSCVSIVTTGQKATDILMSILGTKEPKVGEFIETVYCNHQLRIYRMPSSSRAYPKPLQEKASVYEKMFSELGLK